MTSLDLMCAKLGEDRVKTILSSFSCPLNKEVDSFLKQKAIPFSRQGIAKTQLIFVSHKGRPELIAYFSLANKYVVVDPSRRGGNARFRRRINKFAKYDPYAKAYILPCPLIGQLGKNYQAGLNTLISGNEVLKIACDMIAKTQKVLGGHFIYLECEEKPYLLEFYAQNGFCNFDKRPLDADERDELSGDYLIQMLKYLD